MPYSVFSFLSSTQNSLFFPPFIQISKDPIAAISVPYPWTKRRNQEHPHYSFSYSSITVLGFLSEYMCSFYTNKKYMTLYTISLLVLFCFIFKEHKNKIVCMFILKKLQQCMSSSRFCKMLAI